MPPRPADSGSAEAADISFRRRGLRLLADTPLFNLPFTTSSFRRVLLIHGFAIGEKSAIRSMEVLRRNLGRRSATLRSQTFTMTWPGDKALYLGGPAAYPWLKNVAVDTGDALFQFVMAEYSAGRGSEELILVAHSLGCRVTLEFLERLQRAGRPHRLGRVVVILMAAAVPVELDALIRGAVSASDSVVVLHSGSDWALRLWFRFGQTFAGEGHMPEAIGLNGLPSDPGWTDDWQMTGFGHSDYWLSNETAEIIGLALRRDVPSIVLGNDPERVRTLPLPPGLPSRDLLALHDLARSADAARR